LREKRYHHDLLGRIEAQKLGSLVNPRKGLQQNPESVSWGCRGLFLFFSPVESPASRESTISTVRGTYSIGKLRGRRGDHMSETQSILLSVTDCESLLEKRAIGWAGKALGYVNFGQDS